MPESEIKKRLERALHTHISLAEWRELERQKVLAMLEEGSLETEEENWREFVPFAGSRLQSLRTFKREDDLEQRGELAPAHELGPKVQESVSLPDVSAMLSDRTSARGEALSALTRLRMGDDAVEKLRTSGRARISSTVFPRGGIDGTPPQWVIVMAVEAWVPADDVKESYGQLQQAFLAERPQPKTQARTFQVAAFVWNQERVHGKRPSWPVLCEQWNNLPLTEPFADWRAFRMCFLRGAEATPPRYVASNEQITNQMRSDGQGVLDVWA